MRFNFSLGLLVGSMIVACGDDTSQPSNESSSGGGPTSGPSGSGGVPGGGGGGEAGAGATGGGGAGIGGTGGNAGGSGGAATGGAGGAAPSGPCPVSPPTDGSVCTNEGTWCSWGDDPRYGCRIAANCVSGQWARYPAAGTWNCPQPPPPCPGSAPPDADLSCTDQQLGLTCVYQTVAYTCTNCDGSLCFQTDSWSQGDLDPACPVSKLPNMGDACSMDGLQCDYNHCADDQEMFHVWAHGVALTCDNGVWTMWNTGTFCL